MNTWEKLTDTCDSTSGTILEFNKRYESSILAWEKPKETIFIKYQYYDKEENHFVFDLYQKESVITIPYDYSFNNEKLYIPKIKKGFYYSDLNFLNRPIAYIAHNPLRQWIRGITSCNYTLLNFTNYLQSGYWVSSPFSRTIYPILKQQKTQYNITLDVFNQCTKNNHVILNTDFLLTQNVNDLEGFSVFYHKYLVGTFITPTKFKINNTLFLQEFLEEKENWNFTFSIIYPND